MTPSPPLRDALPVVAQARPLLLALDFDGTLAPLVDNPDDARMTPGARAVLDRLTDDDGVVVALVSGRGAYNLSQVSFPDRRWWLVGSHGVEIIAPGDTPGTALTPEKETQRQLLWQEFQGVANEFEGVWVEQKTWGAALHTRGVAPEVEAAAHRALTPLIGAWGSVLTSRTGHGILEASLAATTKGDGISHLHRAVTPQLTVFIGDDVTDEDGFAVLGDRDVAIRVGGGDSRAPYRLTDPVEVAAFLEQVAVSRGV